MPPDEGSNPLERTPDMANLTPAERARIYKERAAAAGIGRPPAAGGDGAPPPLPRPPQPPPAARPSDRRRGRWPGGRRGCPDARAARAAGGRRPARCRWRRSGAPRPRRRAGSSGRPARAPSRPVPAARLRLAAPGDDRVPVGGADADLDDRHLDGHPGAARRHANADKTPNPSKAPWYFLNLQELLLHMHPALAGVIIPSVALALIAIIPYFDRDNTRCRQVVRHAQGARDHLVHDLVHDHRAVRAGAVRRVHRRQAADERRWSGSTGLTIFTWPSVVNIVVPMILMIGPFSGSGYSRSSTSRTALATG